MRPDKKWVEAKFRHFNQLCFEGKLPPVAIKITNASSYLGKVTCSKKKTLLGKWRHEDFNLLISNRRDLAEEVLEDTVLHELIHYHILLNGIKDTSPHGKIFRSMMHDFNRRFGRNMSIRHRVTEEEHARNQERRSNLVCVARLKNGKRAVMVAARSCIFKLWNGMESWDIVEDFQWVYTDHPLFSRFPRSRTLKLYKAGEEELTEALKGARCLERTPGSIIVTRKVF